MEKKIKNFVPLCDESKNLKNFLKEHLDIDHIITFEVDHCPQSYGILLQSSFGKIIYSGDTRPCQNLINYSKSAKILIHEATFNSNQQKEALIKKHTTTSEAIEIIKKT